MLLSAKQIIDMRESVGVVLNQIDLGTFSAKKNLIIDPKIWHGFVIHTEQDMTQSEVISSILEYVYPYELIPLLFEHLGENRHFMFIARDCFDAIHKLCSNNLLVPNIVEGKSNLKCELVLGYSDTAKIKINLIDRLRSTLQPLYDSKRKTLHLANFCKIEGSCDYLPLCIPKILHYVLNNAYPHQCTSIMLGNNRIRSLSSQEVLWKFTNLQHLDLRNNKIEDMTAFNGLEGMKLTSLNLDGNPICKKMDAYSYVTELKNIFPNLQNIDGEFIEKDGVPATRKNFLCDMAGFTTVDNFIETFFNLYDKDRKSLQDLYHPNAICSITNLYKIGQITSNSARLRPYQVNCRNLLAMADVTRSHTYLIRGNQCIVRKLIDLPRVQHDPYSFTIDLIFYSEKTAIINVCGVFREIHEGYESFLGFARTFSLSNYHGNYVILNDMFHVYNALSIQVSMAFSMLLPNQKSVLPPAQTSRDMSKAIDAFKKVTGLTTEWSIRFLERDNFDLVESIKSFMDMYKVDQIPQNAFMS